MNVTSFLPERVENVENKNISVNIRFFRQNIRRQKYLSNIRSNVKTSEVAMPLVSVTWKQEMQTSRISSKAIDPPFNKTSLVFADCFTGYAHHT